MRRIGLQARADWRTAAADLPYIQAAAPAAQAWREDAAWEFTAAEIDWIEGAADEVAGLISDAVAHVNQQRLLPLYGYSQETCRMIGEAWRAYWRNGVPEVRDGGLFGRLDFAYDGDESLKLLGCNFDVADGLFMAAIVQWSWLQNRFPDADQFNGLHEALVERWGTLAVGLRGRERVHLTCPTPNPAREGELAYLAAVAEEAGFRATVLPVQEIGWDGAGFRDLTDDKISWLLKLYPWEAMVEDDYGRFMAGSELSVLDPLWRVPASNHALLATLWELYPEHPNLCRASMTESEIPDTGHGRLTRSLFGLDAAAARLIRHGELVAETAPAQNPGGFVHLAMPPTSEHENGFTLLHCWLVGDKCLGLTVAETDDPLLRPAAAVLPHLFR